MISTIISVTIRNNVKCKLLVSTTYPNTETGNAYSIHGDTRGLSINSNSAVIMSSLDLEAIIGFSSLS